MPARNRSGQLTQNQQVDELNQYSPVLIRYSIAADASAGVTAFTAPFPMTITDISVLAQATSGGGTVTPRKGTDAMCTAIACATDGTMSRLAAGAVVANIARLTLATGDSVTVITNGAADRGIVTFTGVRA